MKSILICLILLKLHSFAIAQIKSNTTKAGTNWTCILKVEIEASFPGGQGAWKNYLKQNFREKEVLCQMSLTDSAYTQTAEIWFVIDRDGSIINVKCVNQASIDIALKNEAIRLIAEAPKWIPGQRNGRHVKAFRKEKISITVSPLYL